MFRRQPIVAARALGRLIQDPEQTEQVFVVMRSLTGDALTRGHARFAATAVGRHVLTNATDLLTVLNDRAALAQLPDGSLGRAYLDFVTRAGITADGLVAASDVNAAEYAALDPSEAIYARRLRDMHDLWHVVTGFATQPFGEVCVVAFSYAQTQNLGFAVIALIGALKIARESAQSGVLRAAWQAYRIGRRAAWMPGVDWEGALAKPLATVRAELRLSPPTRYQALATETHGWHTGVPAAG